MHRAMSLRQRWARVSQPARARVFTVAVVVLALLTVGTVAVAAAPDSPDASAAACPAGADLLVHPGGTWSCGPQPSPSSLTESPLPSTSPSASASPTGSPSSSPSPSTSSPSASPSASPSPTATSPSPSPSTTTTGPRTGCWADPGKCGYPTPATTGVPAGTVLSAYTGPTTIRSATVIDGKTIGCLDVSGGNVIIRRSRITCSSWAALEVQGSANVLIEDSEISCVNGTGTGIDRSPSGSFVARRVYIHDCENGLHMESGTTVEDSYIMVRTVGSAHSDGIQGVSGAGIVIRHNTIRHADLGSTSSIIFAGQNMPGLVVQDNLFSGGAYTVYCPSAGSAVYSGNRFAGPVKATLATALGPVYGPAFGYTDGCGRAGIVWTGNVRDDTGAVISA